MKLPESYEQSVICHETRFTPYFAAKGYVWDTYVQTDDMKDIFVNPIMACPRELLQNRGCPFFKRRSLFHALCGRAASHGRYGGAGAVRVYPVRDGFPAGFAGGIAAENAAAGGAGTKFCIGAILWKNGILHRPTLPRWG